MTTTSKAKTAFMPLGLKLACPVVFIVVVAALGAYFGLVSQARSRRCILRKKKKGTNARNT